jgi:hypothetical protein
MVGVIGDAIITQRYLNTSTYVGDPAPGTVVATSSVSGSIVQSYGGQVGKILVIGKDAANYYTDPVNGQQLYAGNYQYVQFYASSTAAAAVQGQIVFWLDSATNLLPGGGFIVTPDFAAPQGQIAGIALCNTAKGNYWFIQTAGIAEVKFGSIITKTTPQVGDLVFVNQTPTQYADVLGDNETVIVSLLKLVLGRVWETVPVVNTISPVMLGIGGPQYYPGGGGGVG